VHDFLNFASQSPLFVCLILPVAMGDLGEAVGGDGFFALDAARRMISQSSSLSTAVGDEAETLESCVRILEADLAGACWLFISLSTPVSLSLAR
jgi:hypothetical protein